MRNLDKWILGACFFLSGATSLILEVAWSKQLSYLMGNTLYAIVTVVAAFMGGLCIGSALAGRWGGRIRRPLLAYASMEIAIGICGLASIPALRSTGPVFAAIYGALPEGHGGFLMARFAVVMVLLLLPTTLMGMTLPIVIGAYARRKSAYDPEAGTLYGINTLGAVAGTIGTGFFILPALGLLNTCFVAGVLDLSVAGVAFWLNRRVGTIEDIRSGSTRAASGWSGWTSRQWIIGIVFGMSGAIAMIYEVGWFRLLGLTTGPSVYAFAAMLGMFLIGIGLGSVLAAPWAERTGVSGLTAMAVLEALLGVAGLAGLLYANRLPIMHNRVFLSSAETLGSDGALVATQLVVAGAVVLPGCLLMGALFPEAVRAFREQRSGATPESNVGALYMLNTAGSIIGITAGGFWMMPAIGVWKTIMAAGLGSAALAIALFAIGSAQPMRRLAVIATVVIVTAGLATVAPDWDTAIFNDGFYRSTYQGQRLSQDRLKNRRIVYFEQGINAPVAVYNVQGDASLRVSGKADASTAPWDLFTQSLSGHIPMMFSSGSPGAARAARVAMIGYGSGMTAEAILSYPNVESLEIVEIEEAVIGASPYFESINGNPFKDPRTRLVVEDGRTHLTYSQTLYDVITSEPSNPWMAGVSNLFTEDFYRTVRSRLAEGGVFAQHLQSYDISFEAFQSVVASIREVFPFVAVFRTTIGDNIILAAPTPPSIAWEEFVARFQQPGVRRSISRIGIDDPCQVPFFLQGAPGTIDNLVRDAPIHSTDDNVWLEYRMAFDLVTMQKVSKNVGHDLAWASAPERLTAIRELLPGMPLDRCVRELVRYPFTMEPVNVQGRTSADPWISIRARLAEGLAEDLTSSGREDLAGAVEGWDLEGQAYLANRLSITESLTQILQKGSRPDIESLQRVLADAPDHPLALILYGDALFGQGNLAGAEAAYGRVLDHPISTACYNALIGLARVAMMTDGAAPGLQWLRQAIERNPYLADAYLLAAQVHLQTGDAPSAREVLEQGVDLNPDNAGLIDALAKIRNAG